MNLTRLDNMLNVILQFSKIRKKLLQYVSCIKTPDLDLKR